MRTQLDYPALAPIKLQQLQILHINHPDSQRKYGERIQDLIPMENSRMYLYGDRLSSPRTVEEARKKIFKS